MRNRSRCLITLACCLLVLPIAAILLVFLRPVIEPLSWERSSRDFLGWEMDATSENNIVIAGQGILQYNGLWWRHIDHPQCQADTRNEERPRYDGLTWVSDVEALDGTHVYAACSPEGILRFNGLRWIPMPGPNGSSTYADQLWAQNATSIYALDYLTGLMHSEGRNWSTVSLPDGFDANYVGGNDEYIIVLGETREGVPGILVESEGVWQLEDIQPLLKNVEPDQGCVSDPCREYSVYPDEIWPLQDGRILVRLCQECKDAIISLRTHPLLLCYQDGDWSTIAAPNASWYPKHVTTDDDGYLLAYGHGGDRYRQIPSEEGSGLVWQQLEGEWPGRILGHSVLLNPSQLLVYGGAPYVPSGVMDVSYWLTEPYRLEHYRLEW